MYSPYEIIDLLTNEVVETGFETYAQAVRYFEANGYNYDIYSIEGPAEEEDDEIGAWEDRSLMY
jgi:hypothetical protein